MRLEDMDMRLILISGARIVDDGGPSCETSLSSMSTPFSLLSQQSLDTVRGSLYFLDSFQPTDSSAFPARMNSGAILVPNGLISFCQNELFGKRVLQHVLTSE